MALTLKFEDYVALEISGLGFEIEDLNMQFFGYEDTDSAAMKFVPKELAEEFKNRIVHMIATKEVQIKKLKAMLLSEIKPVYATMEFEDYERKWMILNEL